MAGAAAAAAAEPQSRLSAEQDTLLSELFCFAEAERARHLAEAERESRLAQAEAEIRESTTQIALLDLEVFSAVLSQQRESFNALETISAVAILEEIKRELQILNPFLMAYHQGFTELMPMAQTRGDLAPVLIEIDTEINFPADVTTIGVAYRLFQLIKLKVAVRSAPEKLAAYFKGLDLSYLEEVETAEERGLEEHQIFNELVPCLQEKSGETPSGQSAGYLALCGGYLINGKNLSQTMVDGQLSYKSGQEARATHYDRLFQKRRRQQDLNKLIPVVVAHAQAAHALQDKEMQADTLRLIPEALGEHSVSVVSAAVSSDDFPAKRAVNAAVMLKKQNPSLKNPKRAAEQLLKTDSIPLVRRFARAINWKAYTFKSDELDRNDIFKLAKAFSDDEDVLNLIFKKRGMFGGREFWKALTGRQILKLLALKKPKLSKQILDHSELCRRAQVTFIASVEKHADISIAKARPKKTENPAESREGEGQKSGVSADQILKFLEEGNKFASRILIALSDDAKEPQAIENRNNNLGELEEFFNAEKEVLQSPSLRGG